MHQSLVSLHGLPAWVTSLVGLRISLEGQKRSIPAIWNMARLDSQPSSYRYIVFSQSSVNYTGTDTMEIHFNPGRGHDLLADHWHCTASVSLCQWHYHWHFLSATGKDTCHKELPHVCTYTVCSEQTVNTDNSVIETAKQVSPWALHWFFNILQCHCMQFNKWDIIFNMFDWYFSHLMQ